MAHHHCDLRIHFRFHLALAYLFLTCSLLHPASLRPLREDLHPELVGIVPDDFAGAREKNNAAFNFLRIAPRRTSSTASTTTATEPTTTNEDSSQQSQTPSATVTSGVEIAFVTSLDKDFAEKQPEMKISQVSSSVSVTMSKSVQTASVASLGDDISDSTEGDQEQLTKVRSASEEITTSTTLAPTTSTSTSSESQNDVGKDLQSASADALLGRKIVGFVNLPRLYLTATGSTAINGADSVSSLAGPLETDTHYVYGPIKDVRDTLEAYGVPRPETWLLDPPASSQRLSDAASTTPASTTLSSMAPLVADATISQHSSKVDVDDQPGYSTTDQFTILEYDEGGISDATLIPPTNDEELPIISVVAGPAALIQEEINSNYEGAPSNHVPIAQEKDGLANHGKSSSSLKVALSKVNVPVQVDDEEDDEEEEHQIFMIDEDDGRKYRVEEKTPDGYIVGEYGVISRDSGHLRGVRYTAHAGSANSELIQQALMRFLSL